MRDLVRILQDYCTLNGYVFKYGSEQHLNLLNDASLDVDQIYLLLFPVTRSAIANTNSTRIQGRRFVGRFMLLKGSDYANHYFNENEKDEQTSKYTINIEPLLQVDMSIANYLMCEGLEIITQECDDAVNILDANKDGIWCRFNYIQRP